MYIFSWMKSKPHCHIVELFFHIRCTGLLPNIRGRRGYVQALREKADIETARLLERRKVNTTFHAQVSGMHSLVIALEMFDQALLWLRARRDVKRALWTPCRPRLLLIGQAYTTRLYALLKVVWRITDVARASNWADALISWLASYKRAASSDITSELTLSDEQLQAAILSNVGLKRLIEQLSVVAESPD